MKMRDIMTHDIETLPPDATLMDAAQLMRDEDIGSIPVCEDDRLVGMLTDRDMVVRAVAEGLDMSRTQVRDMMSSPIIYCNDTDDVEEAIRVMEVKQIRRLVVLDHNKRMVGIASIGDIAVGTENEGLSGEVLEQVSEPSHHKKVA